MGENVEKSPSKQQNVEINDDSEEIIKQKRIEALQNVQSLLNISEKYSKYCGQKLQEQLKAVADGTKSNSIISSKLFKGTLLPHQIEGVTWLKILYENGLSGILADEMGLGKTIQIIAILCYLFQNNAKGPFLIVVPLTTLCNWLKEFQKFAPEIPVIRFYGFIKERRELHTVIRKTLALNKTKKTVIITTYETVLNEINFLNTIGYDYVIVDEGHRIKNHMSRLHKDLSKLSAQNKLLLTGTPLQNNLKELWALLHFILPKIFTNVDMFSSLLFEEDLQDNSKLIQTEKSTNVISKIHTVLSPFMLRRLKTNVLLDLVPKKEIEIYCPLTNIQKRFYMELLNKNFNNILCETQNKPSNHELESNSRRDRHVQRNDVLSIEQNENINFAYKNEDLDLKNVGSCMSRFKTSNITQALKKASNHPYLIMQPIDLKNEFLINEDLIKVSGKMIILDALLKKLKERSHKILLFSTFVSMLELIQDYMIMKNYSYRMLTGSQNIEDRQQAVDDFTSHDDIFVFLISTRAGGLGLNLIAADTVIFFDRDWNPQVDIQAQDRCHRIGQNKPVVVYTLITKHTIDEKIISCGEVKKRLEKAITGNCDIKERKMDLEELKQLLESGNHVKMESSGCIYSEEELEKLIDRSDLYEQMVQKK